MHGEEVECFKELLRIRTVSYEGPESGAYNECCEWLVRVLEKWVPLFKVSVVSMVQGKPIVVGKLEGSDPSLEAVLLNAHYDVVPAMDEFWTVDPWAAVEKDGRIYGRGTQDMKSVLIQYVLALARIYRQAKEEGNGQEPKHLFKRNVYLTFVPDEEIGGKDGLGAFISSGEFARSLPNVGVALDEGLATPEKGKNTVFYGERCPLWVMVTCTGPTGHGSRFIDGTATSKLISVANKALAKRKEQEQILGYGGAVATGGSSSGEATGCKHCEAKKLGDVLTINLTVLQAGVTVDGGKTFSCNVIPTKAVAGFDVRVPVTMPLEEVKFMLDEWCAEEGVSWMVDPRTGTFESNSHEISSMENAWWKAFTGACERKNLQVVPEIFPASTDSRFLRQSGITSFGFSPMSGSPVLLHEHDEYIEVDTFLGGIGVYEEIIPSLANL